MTTLIDVDRTLFANKHNYFQINYIEWIVIIFTIFVGLVIEMVNTSIEATTDAIDLKVREDIKIAKDVSAGAMLIYAIGALVIAAIIFLPKISKYQIDFGLFASLAVSHRGLPV